MPSVKFRNGTLAIRCYLVLCSHCEADIKVHHKLKYGSAVCCDACMKESIIDEIDLEDERDASEQASLFRRSPSTSIPGPQASRCCPLTLSRSYHTSPEGISAMLVLTRQPGQTLTITPPGQPPIIITAIETGRNRVRLGIEADCKVKVVRTEIAELDYTKRGAQ